MTSYDNPHGLKEDAGPALHACTLLKPGERLLWAAFSVVVAMEQLGRACIEVISQSPGQLAPQYARRVPNTVHYTLWMLTTARLHVAVRSEPPLLPRSAAPVDRLPTAQPKKPGVLTARREPRKKVRLDKCHPLFDVPAGQIASFAMAATGKKGRRPCLRMHLTDGSGFDFLFGVEDPAVLERLLALSLGGPE
ncbi:MAG: hypothetical protein ABW224_01015 [Kibdelosporangium sp.]